MSLVYHIQFRMPHGVSLRQDESGLIRVTYGLDKITEMRETFLRLREQLLDQAIEEAKRKKQTELERQKIPATRLQEMEAEIQALESQR
jgi:hypothetical protein